VEKIEILKQTDLFKGLPLAFFPGVISLFEKMSYDKRETIFREGDVGEDIYILGEGGVSIILNIPGIGEEEVAILHPYEFFGEMAIIDGDVRSATAIAHKGTELLRISRKDFLSLIDEKAPYATAIMENIILKLSIRIRSTSDKLNMFYLMDMGV
jgi:CRP-like cAMP-binding protein